MYTVDVDIGGTLTDGLVSDGQDVLAVKVDTTPHDFTVCFFDCLREAAGTLGFPDLGAFLDEVAVIRWSSTISTNVLAERKGPRIGLLASPGVGPDLYGADPSPALDMILDPANIAEVLLPLRREEVLTTVRYLLEQGVRRVCVSLRDAYSDTAEETAVKEWVGEQYPDHFLGAVPVLAGTDMAVHPDDRTRTHLALINAYVHTPLAISLFKAEEELLHLYGYRRPLYIGHVSGGVARVAKTKGFDTLESGPVFGVHAAAYFAGRYGHDRVLAFDVGGTTAKIAVIVGHRPVLSDTTDMFGIPIETPWILLRSVALGGGSVARATADGVTLGPESMGAFPGPACYDLGGGEATLTDAFVVAGLLDPDRFLGGRRRLDTEAARRAVHDQVGLPLGVDIDTAAGRIIDAALTVLERAVHSTLTEAGLDSRDFEVYGFGGNGALLTSGLAERLGLEQAHVFRLGHVFSAFGSSVSDVCHVQEEYPSLDTDTLTRSIEAARARVRRDLEGEADPADVELGVEILVRDANSLSSCEFDGARTAADLAGEILQRTGSGELAKLTVRGTVRTPRYEPAISPGEQNSPEPAVSREACWNGGGAVPTGIHDWDALEPGARLHGPAVVEASANTCAVRPGWTFEVDGFGNGRLVRGKR